MHEEIVNLIRKYSQKYKKGEIRTRQTDPKEPVCFCPQKFESVDGRTDQGEQKSRPTPTHVGVYLECSWVLLGKFKFESCPIIQHLRCPREKQHPRMQARVCIVCAMSVAKSWNSQIFITRKRDK